MKTIHDENLIKELLEQDCSWTDSMKQYAEYIRNKTIDECIERVPKKYDDTGALLDVYQEQYEDGHNSCREQTITNLNNLKNNG